MKQVGTKMVCDGRIARHIFEQAMTNPARNKSGFGLPYRIAAFEALLAGLPAGHQAWLATGEEDVASWQVQQ